MSAKSSEKDAEKTDSDKKSRGSRECTLLQRISEFFTLNIEIFFLRWGRLACSMPKLVILLSVVLCGVACAGNIFYSMETDDELLWTPFGSPFIEQKKWIARNFPKDRRNEFIIAKSSNILTAQNINFLLDAEKRIEGLVSKEGKSFGDLCYRYPGSKPDDSSKGCVTQGILGIYRDKDNLTDESVRDILTEALQHDVPGEGSLREMLSGLQFTIGQPSQVQSATACLLIWFLKNSAGKDAMSWEDEYISYTVSNPSLAAPDGLQIYSLAERSYDDEIDYVVNSNITLLLVGFVILFVYVALVLGNINIIEQRVLVSLAGLVVIGMATGCAFGLGFYFQLKFNDMTPIIPFLLLGIGVDDMFVIVQCLDNLEEGEPEERVARALQHAGLSITVTSFTDLVAFLIGATTSMPILRSFCLFAGAGVLFLYIFAVTFFVGCLLLDERRKKRQLDRRPDFKPPAWTRLHIGSKIFRGLAKFILHPAASFLIVLATLGMAAAGCYGLYYIETDYDSIWYMRQDSYQVGYYNQLKASFKGQGERVDVYVGKANYTDEAELASLLNITSLLTRNKYVEANSVTFWLDSLIKDKNCSQAKFEKRLGCFLAQPANGNFLADIKLTIVTEEPDFISNLIMGNFSILASRAKFQHAVLDNSTVRMAAMNSVKRDLATVFLSDRELPHPILYNFMYIQWEANEVISTELVRNLSIAFAVIGAVSLLLITELLVAFFVFICVALTLLDMAGTAYFLGLTIEIVTSICLLLSVGLALDYAAHVGVSYAATPGRSKERSEQVLCEMGTAVFNGGLSTFLAFILVAFSDSYVFLTFFKMFGMCVWFGLFHGLVLLPVLLAYLGSTKKAY